VLNFFLFQFT